jgi:hypothetical protein
MTRYFVMLAFVAISSNSFAQQAQIRPGLWEFSMSGMGGQSFKQSICITPAMSKDLGALGRQSPQQGSDCKNTSESDSGKTRSFHVSCTKPHPYEADIRVHFKSPDEFTMEQDFVMTLEGAAQKGSMNMQYRRLGDCPR